MSLKFKATILAAVGSLLLGLVLVSTASPAQAVGCVGSSCTGKGPVANSCDNDASTWTSVAFHIPGNGDARAYLTYSNACNAFWTRAPSICAIYGNEHEFLIQIVKKRMNDELLYRHIEGVELCQTGGTGPVWDWTNMAGAAANTKIKGCVGFDLTSGRQWECTPWWS